VVAARTSDFCFWIALQEVAEACEDYGYEQCLLYPSAMTLEILDQVSREDRQTMG
jgi:hypothetical protein